MHQAHTLELYMRMHIPSIKKIKRTKLDDTSLPATFKFQLDY